MISKILLTIFLTSVSCQKISSLSNATELGHSRQTRSESGQCGVPSQTTSLIVGGNDFTRGTWPWLVALMQKNFTPPKLFCGGVLISANKVVTAAHCIQNKDEKVRRRARDILLLFGAFDLSDLFQSGQLSSSPAEVIIHPDWNPSSTRYDADIAMLMLDDDVPYTKYIRPVCLPTSSVTAREGWVAGWGESEDKSKEHENIPRQIKIPIHSNEHCFLESTEFTQISSKRTICAGAKDKRGPCRGDSGSGLFVRHSNIFYLGGLVSASLTSFTGECDVTNYALYTNIGKFIGWIENPMEEVSISFQTTTSKRTTRPTSSNTTTTRRFATARPAYGYGGGSYTSAPVQAPTCGFMSSATGLIQGGKPASRSLFPWTVVILFNQGYGTFQYFSTGTLISDRLIVTTGLSVAYLHPQTQKYVARGINEFRLLFGVENLKTNPLPQGAFQIDGVSEVIVHPSIEHGSPRIANVGVLKLTNPVQFNSWISPACLPEDDFSYPENEGKFAYAVGWGLTDSGSDSDFKKYAQVKIRSERTCQSYWSEYLKNGKSSKFFCAGGNGRDSTCYRDQPLYLKNGNKWNLRALISIAMNSADGRCDLNYPVLYEDVGQFHSWLKNLMNR